MLFRVLLLLGLALHKGVWELMKVRSDALPVDHAPAPGGLKRAVKASKVGALAFLLLQTSTLNLFPITPRPAALRTVGAALYSIGLATALAGRLQLGRNWANLEDFEVRTNQRLVQRGLYAYVRHPIYAGDLLLLAGLELALNSWLVLGLLVPAAVVIRQASAEEALLMGRFADYREYHRRTKRFVPFIV